MRTLPARPVLPKRVRDKLTAKTRRIQKAADQKVEANRVYASARTAQWFRPILDSLRQMAGPGERCMLCSGSESAEIEHFQPKSVFPERAMTWKNFLWSCGMCNRWKADHFPPVTRPGEPLINPIDENVWEFFYIDVFGNLTPRWRMDLNDWDPRALGTRELLQLDRQALQESRRIRRRELIRFIEDSLARHRSGELSVAELAQRRQDWLNSPAQPDVADYFLNGPGRVEVPFSLFFEILKAD